MEVTIAHISDLHISPIRKSWDEDVFSKGVETVNELSPDVVIVTGDLTDTGLVEEYRLVRDLLKDFESPVVPIPGNHDARNLGWKTFEDYIGERYRKDRISKDLYVVGLDSSEPDVNYGQLGRERLEWLETVVDDIPDTACKCIAMHHHLLPVPGSGRERNILVDAGELLSLCIRHGVDIVLCGHRHVPFAAKVEDVVVVNAGTFSSTKIRGYSFNSFNIIEFTEDEVTVTLKEIETGKKVVLAKYRVMVEEGQYKLVREKTTANGHIFER